MTKGSQVCGKIIYTIKEINKLCNNFDDPNIKCYINSLCNGQWSSVIVVVMEKLDVLLLRSLTWLRHRMGEEGTRFSCFKLSLALEYADCIHHRRIRSPSPQKKCPEYDTKLHLMLRHHFWGLWSTFSLPLLSGPLWSRVIVLVSVPSIGQIDWFEKIICIW